MAVAQICTNRAHVRLLLDQAELALEDCKKALEASKYLRRIMKLETGNSAFCSTQLLKLETLQAMTIYPLNLNLSYRSVFRCPLTIVDVFLHVAPWHAGARWTSKMPKPTGAAQWRRCGCQKRTRAGAKQLSCCGKGYEWRTMAARRCQTCGLAEDPKHLQMYFLHGRYA